MWLMETPIKKTITEIDRECSDDHLYVHFNGFEIKITQVIAVLVC